MATPWSLARVKRNRPLAHTLLVALPTGHKAPWVTIGARGKSSRTWDREIQWLRKRGLVRHDPKNAKHISWVVTEEGHRLLREESDVGG